MNENGELGVVEHEWSWSVRERREWRPITPELVNLYRLVCTCGFTTHEFHDPYLAQRAAAAHATDGQLSVGT